MLRIPQPLVEQMVRHAEGAYPHEACGVLVGQALGAERTVSRVIACGNARQDSPQDRYQISPQELIAAQKQARAGGGEIVGFYHSHPNAAPQWSATDLAEAHWLHCSYVIVSVEKGHAGRILSFVLEGTSEEDKRFVGESLQH